MNSVFSKLILAIIVMNYPKLFSVVLLGSAFIGLLQACGTNSASVSQNAPTATQKPSQATAQSGSAKSMADRESIATEQDRESVATEQDRAAQAKATQPEKFPSQNSNNTLAKPETQPVTPPETQSEKFPSQSSDNTQSITPQTDPVQALEAKLSTSIVYPMLQGLMTKQGWEPVPSASCESNVGEGVALCDQLPELQSCQGNFCWMTFQHRNRQDLVSIKVYHDGGDWNATSRDSKWWINGWSFTKLNR
jgi:hypothetical protein